MASSTCLKLSNAGQLELLRAFGERHALLRTTVRGASMGPVLRDRDVVTVAPVDGRALRVGDIVAAAVGDAESAQRLVLHRVVARRRGGLLLKGDACSDADGVVRPGDVLGRVVHVERRGRAVRLGTTAGAGGGAVVAALSRSGALTLARRSRRSLRRD